MPIVFLEANPTEKKYTFNPVNFEKIREALELPNKDQVAAVFSANMSHGLPLDAASKHGIHGGSTAKLDEYKNAFKHKSMAGGGQAEQAERWRVEGGLSIPLLTTVRSGSGLSIFSPKRHKIDKAASGKTKEQQDYILLRIGSSLNDFKNTAKKMIDAGQAIVLPIREPSGGNGIGAFITINGKEYELDCYGDRASIHELPEPFKHVPIMIQEAVNDVYEYAVAKRQAPLFYNADFKKEDLQDQPALIRQAGMMRRPE